MNKLIAGKVTKKFLFKIFLNNNCQIINRLRETNMNFINYIFQSITYIFPYKLTVYKNFKYLYFEMKNQNELPMLKTAPVIPFSEDTLHLGNFCFVPIEMNSKHSSFNFSLSGKKDFHKLLWINKGEGDLYTESRNYIIEDFQIYFFSEGSNFKIDQNSSLNGGVVFFKNEIIPQVNALCNIHTVLNFREKEDIKQHIESLLFLLEYEIKQINKLKKLSGLPFYLAAIIQIILRENSLMPGRRNIQNNTYSKFIKNLVSNINKGNDVEYFAKKMNISKESLISEIKTISDKSPKNIIDSKLLVEAKKQLAHNPVGIKEISKDLGFSYPSHFNLFFKSKLGITPKEFRQKYSCIYTINE